MNRWRANNGKFKVGDLCYYWAGGKFIGRIYDIKVNKYDNEIAYVEFVCTRDGRPFKHRKTGAYGVYWLTKVEKLPELYPRILPFDGQKNRGARKQIVNEWKNKQR